jgi:photoactive yellow protein
MHGLPAFDTPKLAEAVEKLTPEQLDMLPFGVIGLDAQNMVRVYNKTEAQLSGYDARIARGKLFFTDVAPCMNNGYFKGRIDKALKAGTLDVSFTFIGDFSDRDRELSVRAQAAKDGGVWIFHRRSVSGE